jgi:hypothetical protein
MLMETLVLIQDAQWIQRKKRMVHAHSAQSTMDLMPKLKLNVSKNLASLTALLVFTASAKSACLSDIQTSTKKNASLILVAKRAS